MHDVNMSMLHVGMYEWMYVYVYMLQQNMYKCVYIIVRCNKHVIIANNILHIQRMFFMIAYDLCAHLCYLYTENVSLDKKNNNTSEYNVHIVQYYYSKSTYTSQFNKHFLPTPNNAPEFSSPAPEASEVVALYPKNDDTNPTPWGQLMSEEFSDLSWKT